MTELDLPRFEVTEACNRSLRDSKKVVLEGLRRSERRYIDGQNGQNVV